MLLPVSYLLMSLPSEGRSLSANQISSIYLHWRLRHNYFRFRNKTSAILEFYFRFRYRPVRRNPHVFLHQATEFHPNRSTYCRNMTSYPFSRWRPRRLNTTSGLVSVDVTASRRSQSISKLNFVEISQMAAEI